MANTEHLPIYKSSYDLCLYLEQVVHGFSRYHKYSLGADLRAPRYGSCGTYSGQSEIRNPVSPG